MAATPWRCSQCGAINEAGARACQGCGKWPSLFDLQDTVAEEQEAVELFDPETFEPEPETFDPESVEPQAFDPQPFDSEPSKPPRTDSDEPERARWKSILSGVIVPLALVVYLLISLLADR